MRDGTAVGRREEERERERERSKQREVELDRQTNTYQTQLQIGLRGGVHRLQDALVANEEGRGIRNGNKADKTKINKNKKKKRRSVRGKYILLPVQLTLSRPPSLPLSLSLSLRSHLNTYQISQYSLCPCRHFLRW